MPGKELAREHETGTLDLSMKKPRSPEYINNHMVHSTQSVHQSPSVSKSSNSHSHTPLIPGPPHQSLYKHPVAHEPANSGYYHPQVSIAFCVCGESGCR